MEPRAQEISAWRWALRNLSIQFGPQALRAIEYRLYEDCGGDEFVH